MSMGDDELLARMAATLRRDIGPAIGDAFPKTQAFMAAVILDKLAGEVRSAVDDERAAAADHDALVADLRGALSSDSPAGLAAAVDRFAGDRSEPAWSALVRAVYDARHELGDARFADLIGRIRVALRGRLDRALAYSR